jgi:glycosyltransferase involved in cell wall biosynthesis
VSVIVPTWNRAEMVIEAVQSALQQDYEPLDVIVVDDGSTDDTLTRLHHVPGIRTIEQGHAGPAAARNRGLEQARGEIIALLDADDLWDSDFVSAGVEALLAHDLDLVFTNWTYEDQQLSLLDRALTEGVLGRQPVACAGEWRILGPEQMRAIFLDGCPAPSSSLLIRRSLLDQGWNERMSVGDDWHLLFTLAVRRPTRAAYSVTRRWTKRVDGHNRFESLTLTERLTAMKHDRNELRREHWSALRPRERLTWLAGDARIHLRLHHDAVIERMRRLWVPMRRA